ncbi:MAG: hypothetical protein HQK68_12985 [Desulfamplus sp.]|nr:hypothetical protein [Desulfamplus sp.]
MNRLKQTETIIDSKSSSLSIPVVHNLIIGIDGTIKKAPTSTLQGMTLNPSGFFGKIHLMQPKEIAVVFFPDMVDGVQRVHFVKRYIDYFAVNSFVPNDFFPFPIVGKTQLFIAEDGIIWFSHDPRQIGNVFRYSPISISSGNIYLSFTDKIADMSQASMLITQDITDEVKIVLGTASILLIIFWIFSLHTSRIQKEFTILQKEHNNLTMLIQNLSFLTLQPGANLSYRLEHLAPALNKSLEDAGNTPFQFEDNNQYYLLVQEFINSILLLVDAVNKERDKLKEYQDHLEDLVKERTMELIIAKEASEAANRAKSNFLSTMSHELRTPLNAVIGFSHFLRRGDNLTPEQQENLRIINRNGEHLLTLINDILDMSKIESGQTVLNNKEFDLYIFLNDLHDMFGLKAQQNNLNLIFEVAEDIPRYVIADETKLRQIFINLIGNALKFTEKGEIFVRVKAKRLNSMKNQKAQEQLIICEVEDTGVGISPDELNILFEAFVQTESGRRSQQGTGLGLSISRKFVQLMGGDITVKSKINKGSIFKFEVQVKIPDLTLNIIPEATQTILQKADSKLIEKSISFLPKQLKSELKQATLIGDMTTIEMIIEHIRFFDALLAEALMPMAENFNYEKILELLVEKDSNND